LLMVFTPLHMGFGLHTKKRVAIETPVGEGAEGGDMKKKGRRRGKGISPSGFRFRMVWAS